MAKGSRRETRTFRCVCGHLAYQLPRKGWRCMCAEPKPFNGTIEKSQVKPI